MRTLRSSPLLFNPIPSHEGKTNYDQPNEYTARCTSNPTEFLGMGLYVVKQWNHAEHSHDEEHQPNPHPLIYSSIQFFLRTDELFLAHG